jgi:hypothetical protein
VRVEAWPFVDLIDLARVALPHRKAIFFISLLHLIHVALRLHGFMMSRDLLELGGHPRR